MSSDGNKRRRITFWAAGILLLFVAAQSQAAQVSQEQRQAKAQAALIKEVRHVLVTQPFYSVFDNLAFKVDGDRVTLLGQVVKPTLKTDAEASVKQIEGVASVVNQIEVLPPSGNDDQLRRALFRAIYSAPGMEKYAIQAVPPIHIVVKGGNVTLVGVVDNTSDKTVVDLRAKMVPGAFTVMDELMVQG